jgi:hypothetical protein
MFTLHAVNCRLMLASPRLHRGTRTRGDQTWLARGREKSSEAVAHLQTDHNGPRYWARTLTTRFLKENESA